MLNHSFKIASAALASVWGGSNVKQNMNISPIAGRGQAEVVIKKKLLGGATLSSMSLTIPVLIDHPEGEEETEIILPDIAFASEDTQRMAGRVFAFPVNPHDGYIDGSVYFAGVHNPVDCDQITFLSEVGSRVSLKLHCVFDFEYEGPVELGKREETITVDLPVVN